MIFQLTKTDIYEFGLLYDDLTRPQWKSVKNELPPRDKIDEYHESDYSPEVLVWTDKGDVLMTQYDYMFEEWYCNLGTPFTCNVTHWMPKPEGPEKETDDEDTVS